MRNIGLVCAVALFSAGAAVGQSVNPAPVASHEPVFRKPFTLRLHIDKEHFFEEHIERKIPFVADGDVFLFAGESFGINIVSSGDTITDVYYQPNLKLADVTFE